MAKILKKAQPVAQADRRLAALAELFVRLALIKEIYAWTCGNSMTSRIGSTLSAIQ